MSRRENRVEPIAGRWVVSGLIGCPHCRAEITVSLEIPEEFLGQVLAEGARRERERADPQPLMPSLRDKPIRSNMLTDFAGLPAWLTEVQCPFCGMVYPFGEHPFNPDCDRPLPKAKETP